MISIPRKANCIPKSVGWPTCHIRLIYSIVFVIWFSVDIKYCLNGITEERKNIKIGRMPIMLGCSKCHLSGKT